MGANRSTIPNIPDPSSLVINPSAVFNGDVLNSAREWGYYDNGNENIATEISTRATEDFGPSNLGVEMSFSTCNNNAGTARTEKLRLDSAGVKLNNAF